MAFVEHRFGKTYFTKKGPSGKIPIVWLHGGPGGMHKADAEVFQLSENRPVYCYTQVGSGRSSPTEKNRWNIETFVAELGILIKAWGLKEFHLMGGSWGTTLALEYYLRQSGRGVRSLVFQSPLFNARDWMLDGESLIKDMPKRTQKIINTCHEIAATDAKVYQDAMYEYYLKHVLRDPKKLKAMFSRLNPNGKLIYQHMWGPSEFKATGTLKSYTRSKDLSKIKVPTMIICGEHDEARPATGVKYANRISGCAFAAVKGASHSIWSEKPKKMKTLINDFLSDID
ncbi:MAG: proline iminopeptidase [Candidatus Azotimanducaceae bacterium]